MRLRGARVHNLKGVELEAPFGRITGVCGHSGSGKSTLVLEALVPALRGEAPDGDAPIVSGESGCAAIAGLIAAAGEPALREALALGPDAKVVAIGSEGATDPEIYARVVGRSAEEVRQSVA